MATSVFGIFKYENDAESAINELKDLNYDPKDITIVMKDLHKAENIQSNTGAQAAQGAATGAVAGGAIMGLAGFLVGVGAITIPGIGALLVGGPLATALGLTGVAATTTTGIVTGAAAGGLAGALINLGFSQTEAQEYEEQIRGGGILIAVPARDSRTNEVRNILEKNKASGVRQLELPSDVQVNTS